MIPFSIKIYNIVELRILRWWLDVMWLENRLDEFVGLCRHLRFQVF